MKPVLILQHLTGDGPAYLGTWLGSRGVPFEVRNAEAGQLPPDSLQAYSAMAILGGEMSANDDLPALRRAEALFRQALAQGVPTLGHCLGGQLMARALGATVGPSRAAEIGWQRMHLRLAEPGAATLAQAWFGSEPAPMVYQWHFEAFALPAGAVSLATSEACEHQAFAIGPHLGMQFHVEVDLEKVERWSHEEGERWAAVRGLPSVQDGRAMRAVAGTAVALQQAMADRVYARWLSAAQG